MTRAPSRTSAAAVVAWVLVLAVGVVVVVFGLFWPDSDTWDPPVEDYAWRSRVARPDAPPLPVNADVSSTSVPEEAPWEASAYDEWVQRKHAEAAPDPLDALEEVPAAGEGSRPGRLLEIDLPPAQIEEVPEDMRDWIGHIVVPLEEVDQIAHRYGVRSEELRMWNGIKSDTERLRPGTSVRVRPARVSPPRQKIAYVVGEGDSWWSIGCSFGVDSYVLRAHNWDADQQLKVGQTIRMWIDPVVFQWIAVEERDDDSTSYIRPGATGIGLPQKGRLVNGVAIPPSEYYTLRLPPSSYGTSHAVAQLLEAIVRFRARSHYEAPLVLGTMSRRHGGPMLGHLSHQTGRDLDVRLPLKGNMPATFEVTPRRVDWLAVWHLVGALADTRAVAAVFLDYEAQKLIDKAARKSGASAEERRRVLQYPHGAKAGGLVRHSPGHEAHMHIRFTCGALEPECVGSDQDPAD